MCMLIALKLYCVLELRYNSTEFEELEVSVMDLTVANAVSRIFATVKSTIDSDNTSNTVLLFLFYEILSTCTHYFENIQINDEIYALFIYSKYEIFLELEIQLEGSAILKT